MSSKNTRKQDRKQPKIGLALCSGGARGLSHVGVLKALTENNIYPDFITGTSMGAVIGGLYTAGLSPDEIDTLVTSNEWKKDISFVKPEKGLINGKNIISFLKKSTYDKSFTKSTPKLAIISADIKSGEKVTFKSGKLAPAMYSSMAIPGLFTPHKHNDRKLVDGGILEPLPIEELEKMGAEIIIAVDLSLSKKELNTKENKIFGIDLESSFIIEFQKKLFEAHKEFIKEYLTKFKGKDVPDFAKMPIEKAVDKFFNPEKILKKNYFNQTPEIIDVLARSVHIMNNQLISTSLKDSDNTTIIKPNLNGINVLSMDKASKSINAGYLATSKKIDRIKRTIKNHTK